MFSLRIPVLPYFPSLLFPSLTVKVYHWIRTENETCFYYCMSFLRHVLLRPFFASIFSRVISSNLPMCINLKWPNFTRDFKESNLSNLGCQWWSPSWNLRKLNLWQGLTLQMPAKMLTNTCLHSSFCPQLQHFICLEYDRIKRGVQRSAVPFHCF